MTTSIGLNKLVEQCQPLSDRYLGKQRTGKLIEELRESFAESRPQIMLFGAYNGGKSSLINALIGEAVAPVADIPETDSVNQYKWNGCTLLDTPGVNAPIEHEEVTAHQIERSMLMLFVIREGDQDVKDVYQRMFDFIKRGKKLFIVFNHQLTGGDLEKALTKLNEQLFMLAACYNITDEQLFQINIIAVNVKTAMTAKLKNSERLAQHSGIIDFEQQFHSWLSLYDNETGYLQQIKGIVKSCLLKPITIAIQEEAPKPSTIIEEKQQLRETAVKQQGLLISKVNNFIRSKEINIRAEVGELFNRERQENEVNSSMHSICQRLCDDASNFIEQNFENLPIGDTTLSGSPVSLGNNDDTSNVNVTELAIDMFKKADHKSIVKESLLQLRKLKIPGIKGRWGTTLDKWAGKAAPLIQVGIVLWDIKRASDAENEYNEKIRKQQFQLQKVIESGTENIISGVQEACKNAIDLHYTEITDSISDEIDKEQEQEQQIVLDLELILRYTDELEAITI